jgi:hypothetical protein
MEYMRLAACKPGTARCAKSCVSLATASNCGFCGNKCGKGTTCVGGQCQSIADECQSCKAPLSTCTHKLPPKFKCVGNAFSDFELCSGPIGKQTCTKIPNEERLLLGIASFQGTLKLSGGVVSGTIDVESSSGTKIDRIVFHKDGVVVPATVTVKQPEIKYGFQEHKLEVQLNPPKYAYDVNVTITFSQQNSKKLEFTLNIPFTGTPTSFRY